MSYGFQIRALTAALAVAALPEKFDEVVNSQPVHSNDRDQAIAAATAMVEILGEPGEGQEISVSVSGSLQWHHPVEGDSPNFIGASVSVAAHIVSKQT